MNEVILLNFGENNKIEISEITSRVNKVSEEERRTKGDIEYQMNFQCDGFYVSIKIRDLFSGIELFKDDLEKMSTQLIGKADWYNSDVASFGMENNFHFNLQIDYNGKIDLIFEVNSGNTELKYNGIIDQTYLSDWIKEIEKIK